MRLLLAVMVVALALAGCTSPVDPVYAAMPPYDPDISAADFVEGIDHPYLPFIPGATWTYYIGTPDDFEERIEVEVLEETRDIQGVNATVVRDTVYDDAGAIVEDTFDWYAQDRDGNVWYLGEDTCEYEDGECVTTAGSFEWGVDGALPGIVMPEPPRLGEPYYQEYYRGEAVDRAQVIGVDESVTTVLGTFTDTVHTLEWSPLEPRVQEHVYYAPGVGPVIKGEAEEGDTGMEFDGPEQLYSYHVPYWGSGSVE